MQLQLEENQIEALIENLDTGDELEFNTLYEDLELYLKHPLNLNTAEESDLKESRLFNDVQIGQLIQHRTKFGKFLSTHELQSIPSFDLRSIKVLEPFVTVESGLQDYNLSIPKMLANSKSEMFFKWRRILEDQVGYDESRTNGYVGDPNKMYFRYRLYHENRFRIGLLAEKDAGESFFGENNAQGFDFYSGHIHLKEYSKQIKDIIIGDYNVSLGQGLILHNGFGSSKSAFVMDIKKGGRKLRSYNSVNEINFFRGVATTLAFGSHINTTAFASYRKLDANILLDTISTESGLEQFSSITTNGNHRTALELEKKGQLAQISAGFNVRFKKRNFDVGVNALYTQFDKDLIRDGNPYNRYRFEGKELTNLSVDYAYRWQNLHWFGESARSDNGAMAHLSGLLIGMDKKMDFSILYRNFSERYQAINPNAFAETNGAVNERGIYTGVILRPHLHWTVSSYFDIWQHQWLRFRQDAPSSGKEFLVNVNYYKKRKFNFYLQYKFERKQENSPVAENNIDKLQFFNLHRLRLHFDHNLSKGIRLRNRIELARHEEIGKTSNGYLIFQDVIYKPIESKFSCTARYSLFDTFDSDSRIYAFENDLIYEFYIPQFSGRGRRYYLNLRFDPNSTWTFEFRIARTDLQFKRETNGDIVRPLSIGTGNERILEPHQTTLKSQIRIRF